MAGPVVTGSLDAVGVVAGALDDPRVGAMPPFRIEVLLAGEAGRDGAEDAFPLFRGERPPGQRPGGGRSSRCA